MYARKLNRICDVRGCKNRDTYAISLTHEAGNTVIICKSCLGKALKAIDEVNPLTGRNSERAITPPPPLFYNDVVTTKVNGEEAAPNEDDSFVCPECGKVFKSESGLKAHMKSHKKELE